MSPLIELAACEFLMASARDRLSGPDADAARRVMDAVGWRWDAALAQLEPQFASPASAESVGTLLRAAQWEAASEAVKEWATSGGAPSGAFKVYIVPESANVTVDLGGGA